MQLPPQWTSVWKLSSGSAWSIKNQNESEPQSRGVSSLLLLLPLAGPRDAALHCGTVEASPSGILSLSPAAPAVI